MVPLLTAIRIIKIMRGTIRGLAAQSADPCFAQRDPWIVQIHALRLTYIYTYIYTHINIHMDRIKRLTLLHIRAQGNNSPTVFWQASVICN